MNITIQQAEKLLRGQYRFKQVGFSMLLTRLKYLYAGSPTPSTLETCIAEINAFLSKYKTVMAQDLAIIGDL